MIHWSGEDTGRCCGNSPIGGRLEADDIERVECRVCLYLYARVHGLPLPYGKYPKPPVECIGL